MVGQEKASWSIVFIVATVALVGLCVFILNFSSAGTLLSTDTLTGEALQVSFPVLREDGCGQGEILCGTSACCDLDTQVCSAQTCHDKAKLRY